MFDVIKAIFFKLTLSKKEKEACAYMAQHLNIDLSTNKYVVDDENKNVINHVRSCGIDPVKLFKITDRITHQKPEDSNWNLLI